MQQMQYRSYRQDIKVYHFAQARVDVDALLEHLEAAGFALLGRHSSDSVPQVNINEGDEVSEGKAEAFYLPNVIRANGKHSRRTVCPVLGICTQEQVEWLVFDQPCDQYLQGVVVDSQGDIGYDEDLGAALALWGQNDNGEDLVLDFVGFVVKSVGGAKRGKVNGNVEHRAWFQSLKGAVFGELDDEEDNAASANEHVQADEAAKLARGLEQWKLFKEAGYDIEAHGYNPKAAQLLGEKCLLEDEDEDEEEDEEVVEE